MTDWFLDYELPPERIAQEPATPRDAARLLVVRRDAGTLEHRVFRDLPELLSPGDLLVLNDTRVLHARLLGKRERTGGKWEGLFLKEFLSGAWEMLCKFGGRPAAGETVVVEPTGLRLELLEKLPSGRWLVKPLADGSAESLLRTHGLVPLPPYLHRGMPRTEDAERYQTVYAARSGAAAAPTAGLHFTPELFERLALRGVERTTVTLHVGLGTFQPIQVENAAEHPMHSEWGELGPAAAEAIAACRARGGRVVAVGTTSVRVLETAALTSDGPWSGDTDLYIRPPYRFLLTGGMITNFHLPRTTLLLLVGAWTGPALLKRAYETAIREGYRFFSYGDAMVAL